MEGKRAPAYTVSLIMFTRMWMDLYICQSVHKLQATLLHMDRKSSGNPGEGALQKKKKRNKSTADSRFTCPLCCLSAQVGGGPPGRGRETPLPGWVVGVLARGIIVSWSICRDKKRCQVQKRHRNVQQHTCTCLRQALCNQGDFSGLVDATAHLTVVRSVGGDWFGGNW